MAERFIQGSDWIYIIGGLTGAYLIYKIWKNPLNILDSENAIYKTSSEISTPVITALTSPNPKTQTEYINAVNSAPDWWSALNVPFPASYYDTSNNAWNSLINTNAAIPVTPTNSVQAVQSFAQQLTNPTSSTEYALQTLTGKSMQAQITSSPVNNADIFIPKPDYTISSPGITLSTQQINPLLDSNTTPSTKINFLVDKIGLDRISATDLINKGSFVTGHGINVNLTTFIAFLEHKVSIPYEAPYGATGDHAWTGNINYANPLHA